MSYILLIILIVITILSFIMANKDLISPSFVSSAVFVFCTFFLVVYQGRWGVEIHGTTVLVITIGLFMFTLGEYTCRMGIHDKPTGKPLEAIYMSRGVLNFLVIISALILILYIRACYATVRAYFPVSNFADMYVYLRFLLVHRDVSLGNAANISYFTLTVIAYIVTYNLVVEIVNKEFEKGLLIRQLIIIILTLFIFLFSTSRYVFFQYFSYVFVIYNLAQKRKHGPSYVAIKSMKIALVIIVIAMLVFVGAGQFSGKSSFSTFAESVAEYTASPIIALDFYLEQNGVFSKAHIFGEETLLGCFALINRLFGTSLPTSRILEFIQYGNTSTNVYTCFRRYIHDYGLFGMLFIQFLYGYFINWFYRTAKSKQNKTYTILFSYLAYTYFLQCFDEEIMTTFLAVHTLMMFGLIILIVNMMEGSRRIRIKIR